MKEMINTRVASLREWLKQKKLAAYIIPSTDPHLSEYISPHWMSREWISGFNGSAGTVVVTLDKAGLWTDSRYFIQGSEQLEGTVIDLFKENLPGTPSISTFLGDNLPSGSAIGVDGKVFAVTGMENLQKELSQKGFHINTSLDPMNELWLDRPPMPQAPAYVYPTGYAGKSCREKIELIRRELEKSGCAGLLVSALDEIAWTLNLRGNDVSYNPVVVSYLLITPKEATCFISPEKVDKEVSEYLRGQQVSVQGYGNIEKYLSGLELPNILLNPAQTNYSIYSAINPSCTVVRDSSPVALLKATRNEEEIKGLRNAMKKDGVALVKFLVWLEEVLPSGRETEISITQKLKALRAEQELYMGESFQTIAGYKEHGAIVHYSATPESDVPLRPESFLLLDSGAQYLDGTTDITRTIALGELTEEEKTDYTLILKGHIALAKAKFPSGTRGAQLDVLARMPLWENGMNYLHGTGHGIGHFLNVHEGPQSIRMNENPITLQPGMVTSNEPGVYKEGSHGVRIENLVLTVKDTAGMYGEYLRFETLSLCPICKKGIRKEMLTAAETDWLNSYHQTVFEKLSGYLNDKEKNWLKKATGAI